jgi:geranylgeranyl pyrophosphate synthase
MAGDILLLKAQTALAEACEKFPLETRTAIRHLVEGAFTEIGCAVAKERQLKANLNVRPTDYLQIVEAKGAISEAFAKIGAYIGNGDKVQIDVLGHFGRTFGLLMAIKNEFVDLQIAAELSHRSRYETVPLPVLYALRDPEARPEVLTLLNGKITNAVTEKIAQLSLNTAGVKELIVSMKQKVKTEKNAIKLLKNASSLNLLLDLSVAGY